MSVLLSIKFRYLCTKTSGSGSGESAYLHMTLECGSVCAVLLVRLATFNVLAALVMGGLGVSGLEPACGLPYHTPGPRYVAARWKDIRHGLCALLRGPPVALLRPLRASVGQHCRYQLCWTSPPSL